MRKGEFIVNTWYSHDTLKNFANLNAEADLIHPKHFKSYPRASVEKSERIFNNQRWSSKFNVIRQIENMENYGQKTAKNIKTLLFKYSNEFGYIDDVYLYKIIVTSNHQSMQLIKKNGGIYPSIVDNHGDNPYVLYQSSTSALKRYLRRNRSNVQVIASSIETGINGIINPLHYFGIHEHSLVATYGKPITRHQIHIIKLFLTRHIHNIVNQSPEVKTCIPLKNYRSGKQVVINSQSSQGDFNSVEQYLRYIYKSKALPIVKTKYQQQRFHELTERYPLQQTRLLCAVLNSSYNVALHSHMQSKAFKHNMQRMLNMMAFIARFHVMETNYRVPISLFDVSKYNHQGMASHRTRANHHGSTKETTWRFEGLNRYTGRPLIKHSRYEVNQGRSYYSHHKVDVTPTKYNDGRLSTSSHEVDETLKMSRNHVDKQTLFNDNEINTS